MNDLVLRMRLDTMRRTLLDVQEVRKKVDAARGDINLLDEMLMPNRPQTIRAGASQIATALNDALVRLQDSDAGDSEAAKLVKTAKEAADKLRDDARKAHDIIKSLKLRWVEIDNERGGRTIETGMVRDAGKCVTALDTVTTRLNAANAATIGGVWEAFENEVWKTSSPLFDEYVDLLGGLALRTVGIGHLVCQRADVLLKLLLQRSSNPSWNSLSIPAHTESLTMTPAQIIRLGFPGWTIWELPLAAHEFGYAVAGVDGVSESFKDARWAHYGDQVLTALFADGFAAYAMGPAYACAALLLRLNPVGANSRVHGEPSHAERAHMVLGILRAMDDNLGTYAGVVTRLESEWQAALMQVGEPPLDAATRALIDDWCSEVTAILRAETPNAEYRAGHWKDISDWVSQMLEKQLPVNTTAEDVRDVLNVAWQCRLQDMGSSESIHRIAEDLWDAVASGGPQSTGGQQPPAAGAGEKGR